MELLRAALAAMGREVTFRTGPWADVRGWLETGDIEALPLVGRTPEREALFDFTFPYMSLHGAIVVRTGTSAIRSLDDLKGRRVAVMKGDNAEEFLRREARGIDIRTTETFEDALNALSRGRCDAVVIQRLLALRLIQKTGITNLKVVDQPVEGFRQDFCFAVREGDRDTLALLNEGLALVMADGTYRHLHAKWFAALNLPASRRIVIGGDDNYPPYEYLDENGQPAGYNVELTRAIAREVGLEIEIRLDDWAEIRKGLSTGSIDAVHGMFYSTDRDLTFDFGPPHCVINHVAVVRQGAVPPETPEELAGLRLVVMNGDIMDDFAIQRGFAGQIKRVANQEDALRELAQGRHECALVARIPALYWITKHGWDNLIVGDTSLLSAEYCYAVPNNRMAILAQLSEGLKTVEKSGEYRRIHNAWLGVYEPPPPYPTMLFKVLALALGLLTLLLLGSFLWSRSLRKQVAARTEALQTSEDILNATGKMGKIGGWEHDLATGRAAWTRALYDIIEIPYNREPPGVDQHLDYYPLPDRNILEKAYARAIRDGTPFDLELQVHTATGRLIWCRAQGKPVRQDGRCVKMRGSFQDITDRKDAEDALQQLAYFPEENPNPVLRVTSGGEVIYANAAADPVLRFWNCRVGNAIQGECRFHVTEAARSGRNRFYEHGIGDRVYAIDLVPVPEKNYVNVYGRDITAEKWNLRRNEILSSVSARLLESDTPQDLVNELCQQVMAFLGCHVFFNFLADSSEGRLHLNACAGIPRETARGIEWLDPGVAVCGCVARDRQRMIREDIQNSDDEITELVKSFGVQAYCCHPLMSGNDLIGTLSFGTRTRPVFDPKEIDMMHAVSDMVALAMQRIRMLTELKQHRHTLEKRVSERTAALESSEARYRTLFEQAPNAVVLIDPETGRLTAFNNRAHEMLGYSHEEFQKLGVADVEVVESAEQVAAHIGKVIREGSDTFETRHRTRDGAVLDIRVFVSAIDLDGKTQLQSIWSDITEQKRLFNAMNKSRQLLEKTLHSLQDAVFVLNGNAEIVECNPAATEIFGHDPDVFPGRTTAFLHADETALETFRQHLAGAVAEKGFLKDFEFRMKRKDGAIFPSEHSVVPLHDKRGNRTGWISVVRDITERKQAEADLTESEAMYRSVCELIPFGFWDCKPDGGVSYLSQSWLDMVGMSLEACKKFGWMDRYAPGEGEKMLAAWMQCLKTGERWEYIHHIHDKEGRDQWILSRGFPMRDAKGRTLKWVGLNIDITERKRIEDNMRRLNAALRKQRTELRQANHELEAFAYSVSHDLRSPLRGIDGYSRLLLEDHAGQLDEEGRFMLGQVRESAVEMGQLIDDLLDFSRMGRREMHMASCNMDGMVKDLFRELEESLPERRLRLKMAPLPPCTGDPAMLRLAVRNLLENAVKYTRPRKEGLIEVGTVPCGEPVSWRGTPQCKTDEERDAGREKTGPHTGDRDALSEIAYFVRDNGVGFDPHYRGQLFQVFKRLHRMEEFEGTGIGLALVRRIVNRHGGRVAAEGRPDRGATFYFSLPGEPKEEMNHDGQSR